MSGGVDGRAAVGFACGVASLLALGWAAAGFFFGPVGAVLALSSLVSTDDPPTSRTRRIAVTGMGLAIAGFAIAFLMVYVSPQGGE